LWLGGRSWGLGAWLIFDKLAGLLAGGSVNCLKSGTFSYKVRLALNLLISPTLIAGSSFGPGEKAKKDCFSRADLARSA
jgi:hypothetical protein